MPISRALLNRLRLPYKTLEIQGSKGDVLYIPDDVGIDLSVMHGVHNGDMVPVKTDADGVVSVAVGNSIELLPQKEFKVDETIYNATDSPQTVLYDLSQYINYRLFIVVEDVTVSGSNLIVTVFNTYHARKLDQLGTVTIAHTSHIFGIIDLTEHKDTVANSIVMIESSVSKTGDSCLFSIQKVGYN